MFDKRQQPRKIFKTIVTVTLDEGRVYEAKSVDISSGGMCLILPGKNLPVGTHCTIRFDLVSNRRVHKISAVSKVTYSICASEGFKIGFQFVKIDSGCLAAVESFMI